MLEAFVQILLLLLLLLLLLFVAHENFGGVFGDVCCSLQVRYVDINDAITVIFPKALNQKVASFPSVGRIQSIVGFALLGFRRELLQGSYHSEVEWRHEIHRDQARFR